MRETKTKSFKLIKNQNTKIEDINKLIVDFEDEIDQKDEYIRKLKQVIDDKQITLVEEKVVIEKLDFQKLKAPEPEEVRSQ